MDLAKEVEIVDGLALGDTLLLERGRDLIGFAIVHTPGVSEAPTGALYVKYLAIDPPQRFDPLPDEGALFISVAGGSIWPSGVLVDGDIHCSSPRSRNRNRLINGHINSPS